MQPKLALLQWDVGSNLKEWLEVLANPEGNQCYEYNQCSIPYVYVGRDRAWT